jgi:hypothetical protein
MVCEILRHGCLLRGPGFGRTKHPRAHSPYRSRPRGDVDYIHDGYIMRRMTKSSPGAAHGGGLPYPPRPLQVAAPRLRHHPAGQRRPARPHGRGAPCRQGPHKGSAQDPLRAHSAWTGDLEGGRRAALGCCGNGAPPFISCASQSQSYARCQLTKYMIVQVQFTQTNDLQIVRLYPIGSRWSAADVTLETCDCWAGRTVMAALVIWF